MFSRRTVCVITGASRGLGKSLATQFTTKLCSGSVVAIMARNKDALQNLKLELESVNPKVSVYCSAVDLQAADQSWYDRVFDEILANTNTSVSDFEQAVIVHNAGSTGDITKWACERESIEPVAGYMTLNLSSMIVLNSHFLSTFRKSPHLYVVEISSSAAIKRTKSWSVYCSGKAARYMFCRVLADEEPGVCVLSYSPSTLDTYMQREARKLSRDPDTRKTYIDCSSATISTTTTTTTTITTPDTISTSTVTTELIFVSTKSPEFTDATTTTTTTTTPDTISTSTTTTEHIFVSTKSPEFTDATNSFTTSTTTATTI